ncbi:MAG: response regulator [SAR324 cluster bacterium]|nr:response regulator [SAR324 cluster bacterium]
MNRILVIDDEDFVRNMLCRHLSRSGYEAIGAENGIDGLEKFNHHQPQVILLDLRMPEMGGIEFLQNLKPEVSSPYSVIVLTGDGTDKDAETCYQLGVKGFLRKPVNLLELRGLVRNSFELVHYSAKIQELNATLEQKVEERTQDLQKAHLQLQISYGELERISKTFQLFVPNQFLNRIQTLKTEGIKSGHVQEEKLTILFTDIRSFTRMTESMSSSETFDFINTYLGHMEPCITRHGGFIDKFIGDGIMALFDQDDSANQALLAALDMQEELKRYNGERMLAGVSGIQVGMAINTGVVRVGALGTEHRLNSTVVGDHVNLASRLEELTKKYKSRILISQYTYDEIPSTQYLIREIDTVQVRGRSESTTVYEAFDGDPSDVKENKQKTVGLFAKGIQLYKGQRFAESWNCFEKCLEVFPEDVIAVEYIKRCRYFQKYPPDPERWDGVILETETLQDHTIRRQAIRYELDAPIDLFLSSDKNSPVHGSLKDISIGGLLLELQYPLQIGEVVTVEILFDQSPLKTLLPCKTSKILCRVVWQFADISPHPLSLKRRGLKFLTMPLALEEMLQEAFTKLEEDHD